jgi:hypothetical protein
MGGIPCLQQMTTGTEAKETGLEHCPGGNKGTGGGNSLRAQIHRRDDEEEDDDREDEEVTPPPHSSPPEDLPSLADIFSRQAGIFVSAHRPTRPQTETGSMTGLPL